MKWAPGLAFLISILFVIGDYLGQQPSQADLEKLRVQQQQQEAQRAAAEAKHRQELADQQKVMEGIMGSPPADVGKTAPRQATERCLSQVMPRQEAFDFKDVPLTKWLSEEATQIPWKVRFGKPQLRVDQRYEVGYAGIIDGKDLRWTGPPQELIYIGGVSGLDGKWLVQPKSLRQEFQQVPGFGFRVQFSDCVFLQPGEYVVWLAVYDRKTERHNVFKRQIRVPTISSDPLPKLNSQSPIAEFPAITGGRPLAPETHPGPIVLPIENKTPFAVELVSIVAPPDQWGGRTDLVRANNNRVLAAASVLSQMQLNRGAVSLVTLDLMNQTVPFRQNDLHQLNWSPLAQTFTPTLENQRVTVPALEALKKRSDFFRNWLRGNLQAPSRPLQVFILVSGSLLFERGTDLSPLKWEGECNCRVYHLRFRINNDDLFDDLGKLIQPLHPKTFNILTPLQFRKAVGEVARDLEKL